MHALFGLEPEVLVNIIEKMAKNDLDICFGGKLLDVPKIFNVHPSYDPKSDAVVKGSSLLKNPKCILSHRNVPTNLHKSVTVLSYVDL